MVVNSYLNFVAGFAVLIQLQAFYLSNFICEKGYLFSLSTGKC